MRRGSVLIGLVTVAVSCGTMPPIGKELSTEPGVSIQRVAEPGFSGIDYHMAFRTAPDSSHCELTLDGWPFELIVSRLWSEVEAIDAGSYIPEGLYRIRATGETEQAVGTSTIRALGDALAIEMRLDPRSRVVWELRCPGGEPSAPFHPATELGPRYTTVRKAGITEVAYCGPLSYLARELSLAFDQRITDATKTICHYEVNLTFDSWRSVVSELAKGGLELVPQVELYHVLMVDRRPEP